MNSFPFSIWTLEESGNFFVGHHYDLRKLTPNRDNSSVTELMGNNQLSDHDSDQTASPVIHQPGQSDLDNGTTPVSLSPDRQGHAIQAGPGKRLHCPPSEQWGDNKILNVIQFVTKQFKRFIPTFLISKATRGLKCILRIKNKTIRISNVIKLLKFLLSFNQAFLPQTEFKVVNRIFHSLLVATDLKKITDRLSKMKNALC